MKVGMATVHNSHCITGAASAGDRTRTIEWNINERVTSTAAERIRCICWSLVCRASAVASVLSSTL